MVSSTADHLSFTCGVHIRVVELKTFINEQQFLFRMLIVERLQFRSQKFRMVNKMALLDRYQFFFKSNEQKRFYKQLYTSEGCDESSDNELLDKIENKLSNEETNNIEGEKVINSFKSNESPGEDGIIAEFCQNYWYLLKNDWMELLKYEFDTLALRLMTPQNRL